MKQTISTHPSFLPALVDKALLQASENDWEQALDSAQRVLDQDRDNIDALQIIAVHVFTQECHAQPHEAIEKLDSLDKAIQSRESASVDLAIETATLFSTICGRQPRALEYCARMLERVLKMTRNNESEARVYSELGRIYLMQGSVSLNKAMKAFRDGTKKDANNMKVLTGLILCQLCEGAYEDAEQQMELLTLMHNNLDDLGYETAFLQSLILKHSTKNSKREQLESLLRVKEMLVQSREPDWNRNSLDQRILNGTKPRYLDNFQNLISLNPDFSMTLALEFFQHVESSATGALIPSTNTLLNSSTNEGEEEPASPTPSAVQVSQENSSSSVLDANGSIAAENGLDLLQKVLSKCPGMVSTYIEIARLHFAMGRFDEAARVLQQCLSLQPQAAVGLIAMALVEAGRFRTMQANRLLEQALASDFSIRSVPKFRLVKAIVRAQQVSFAVLFCSIVFICGFLFFLRETSQKHWKNWSRSCLFLSSATEFLSNQIFPITTTTRRMQFLLVKE
jgi:tetratricopeptide repeat protein 21B